jgi:Fic family protein/molecular chaperone DnaK (HSP70)
MANEIVPLSTDIIPSILSHNSEKNCDVIGAEARDLGLKGKTNAFIFKPDLGLGDVTFAKIKKYWIAPTGEYSQKLTEMLTAKEVTIRFLRELLRTLDLPRHIIIGDPAIRDQAWKDNFKRHMREIFDEIGVRDQVSFFPEPFAVFQYYRHYEKIFPKVPKSEVILVIDIGGGTFSSCIIKTTEQGYLARGGATAVPLGLRAEICGGSEIDLRLLKVLIERAKKKGIVWKDDPVERAKKSRVPVLLYIENAKIALSEAIGSRARLSDDCSAKQVRIVLSAGLLHPDSEVDVVMTGEDLKDVIREMWRRHYGDIIVETINEAKTKLEGIGYELNRLDKVLIAGGSSRLPFMAEEVATVLPTKVNQKQIYLGSDIGTSVALGIACECLEQMSRDATLSTGKIAPCLMNDLYIGFRKSRRELLELPRIRLNGRVIKDGQLFSAPFEINNLSVNYELELPFELSDKVFYYFSDTPLDSNSDFTHLNLSHDVFLIKKETKLNRKCELNIQVSQNGMIKPTFIFTQKGKRSSDQPIRVECPEFAFPNIKIHEGEGALGIDFGTSNSYVVRLLGSSEKQSPLQYPILEVRPGILDKLRLLELEIERSRNDGFLNKELLLKHAKSQALLVVFHSNKIEGNPLTKGETEKALFSDVPDQLSKSQREAFNLEKAYQWILENLDSCFQEPEAFIRHLNKMILTGIQDDGGQYRKVPVKIAGMDFVPPDSASVPAFMQMLGDELKAGPSGRSVLEFAATMHTKLVWIHPFADANGRTARLLLNAILLGHDLPVLVVNYSDKQQYLNALEKSNRGDTSSLIDFLLEAFRISIEDLRSESLPDEAPRESARFFDRDVVSGHVVQQVPTETVFQESAFVSDDEDQDPLAFVMKSKIEELRKYKEVIYETWQHSFSRLKIELESIVEEFNAKYAFAYYRIKLMEFDILPFEKYADIEDGKKFTKTWFWGVEISGPKSTQRLLFFFNRSIGLLPPNASKVSLMLARYDGTSYQKLTSEPIGLREIGFLDGDLVFLYADGTAKRDNLSLVLKKVLAEVIESYL